MSHLHFTAAIIPGAGRGKTLGVPTFNLDLSQVPEELQEGVYACNAILNEQRKTNNEKRYAATMHFGPRPTFGDTKSCEVHVLEVSGVRFQVSGTITVEVIEKLRDIQKFESAEALKRQMAEDGERAKQILQSLFPKT